MRGILPGLAAFAAATAGIVLLLSGMAPASLDRLERLSHLVSLDVIDASHFLSSLIGVVLLLLARGLFLRRDSAWAATCILLVMAAMASLLKGLAWEECLFLLSLLVGLILSRRAFDRPGKALATLFTPNWFLTVALIVIGSLWLGWFNFRHTDYRDDLWWQFALNGDAPRSLRAGAATMMLMAFIGVWRLLSPARLKHYQATPETLAAAVGVLQQCGAPEAHLVRLADKSILLNSDKSGFVMYGVRGRSMIALGAAYAANSVQRSDLVWEFRALADHYGLAPSFYQIRDCDLPLMSDLGFRTWKLGEAAEIDLASFSLEGSKRAKLRHVRNKALREQMGFVAYPRGGEGWPWSELERISDDWLMAKRTREKGFSLGRFDAEYLATAPILMATIAGKPRAFLSLMPGQNGVMAIDLMRHDADMPNGLMEFLFLEAILWAKAEGWQVLDLGLAPLSGLESRPLAPLWNQVALLISKHGGAWYNFAGLRSFKEKFAPNWTPRYLAAPNAWVAVRALTDAAILVSGGLSGVFKR